MTPTPDASPIHSPSAEREGAYPFAAFASRAARGVRLPPSSLPERGGAA